MNLNHNKNFLLSMNDDEYYADADLHRTRIQRKEIKTQWQAKEDGINTHSVKSIPKARKW